MNTDRRHEHRTQTYILAYCHRAGPVVGYCGEPVTYGNQSLGFSGRQRCELGLQFRSAAADSVDLPCTCSSPLAPHVCLSRRLRCKWRELNSFSLAFGQQTSCTSSPCVFCWPVFTRISFSFSPSGASVLRALQCYIKLKIFCIVLAVIVCEVL